jgi:hypothetical protein
VLAWRAIDELVVQPLVVPLAVDQHAIPAEDPIDIVGQVAHRSDDERFVRPRR